MKLKILPRAVRDLADIHTYIRAENPGAANSVALRIGKSFDLITAKPEIGRPAQHARIREWSVPGLPYLIPYRVRGDTVEVLRVFHTSRERPPRWIG
ncbi:MAG: type II toxin-antitoxin system RelE/ParE family toxin [Rhizobiaceae bacterium]|nr:type II toxin-antitoxin system RelE/ParE family toxin [Rhizobiaceae bacterium]